MIHTMISVRYIPAARRNVFLMSNPSGILFDKTYRVAGSFEKPSQDYMISQASGGEVVDAAVRGCGYFLRIFTV